MSVPMNGQSSEDDNTLSKSGTLEGEFHEGMVLYQDLAADNVNSSEMLAQQYQQQ